jgi:GAF domain-containing protein
MFSLPNPADGELTPETLVPRLGEYLLEKGLVSARDLQQALDYQKKKAASGQARLLGHALMALGFIDRETLDKAIVEQIFSLHSALEEANRQLEQRVQQCTQDLDKRTDQIRTTAKLTEVATSTGDLEELLRRSVDLIVMHLRFDHAAIFLLNETGDFVVLQAASGAIGQIQGLSDFRLHVGSPSLVGWVAEQNQCRVIVDINQEPLMIKSFPNPSANSEAGIPISLNDKLFGVLHIQHNLADAFDSEALATLQTIANLIATSTQNYHLLKTAQQNLRIMGKRLVVLDTLEQVNKTISEETNLDILFKFIHEQIVKVMGQVDFLIALYNKETNTIEIPFSNQNGNNLHLPSSPLDDGLTSIVIQNKMPLLLVEDVERQASELGARIVGRPAKSWLGAPLIVSNEAIGAIVVQDQENEQRFDEDDQRLLSSLATQVAITIRNTFQLEDAQKQADRERITAEISTKLWASTDIHTILRTAIQELSQHLDATEGVIQLQVPGSVEIGLGPANNGNKGKTS